MAYNETIHLVNRYSKDKSNRTHEQVWNDLFSNFNIKMNFAKEEDIKNDLQQKDFLFTACSKLNIHILQ
jgi:hypothetical protein